MIGLILFCELAFPVEILGGVNSSNLKSSKCNKLLRKYTLAQKTFIPDPIHNKMRALISENTLMDADKKEKLLAMHDLFVSEKGVFSVEPNIPSAGLFNAPHTTFGAPQITLKKKTDLETYRHELRHFVQWFRAKKNLILRGIDPGEAQIWRRRRWQNDPFNVAEQSREGEEHAGLAFPAHAEMDAMSRLGREENFFEELKDTNSRMSREVTRYLKLAIEKCTLISKDPNDQPKLDPLWVASKVIKVGKRQMTADPAGVRGLYEANV